MASMGDLVPSSNVKYPNEMILLQRPIWVNNKAIDVISTKLKKDF